MVSLIIPCCNGEEYIKHNQSSAFGVGKYTHKVCVSGAG